MSLLVTHPNRTALARKARDGSVFVALSRLERRGLITRRRDTYRLTRRGRDELKLVRALARLVLRTYLA